MFFEGFRFFLFFHQNLIAFWHFNESISNDQWQPPTCRRFATWIARWLGSWVQLLAVQLDMWQRKSWRRNPRRESARGKACYDSFFMLLQTDYSKRIQGLSYVSFISKQCGCAVRACSHLAYLSQWFRSTLVRRYIPHPQVGPWAGLPYFIKV